MILAKINWEELNLGMLMDWAGNNTDTLWLLIIPVIAGLIGWFTNILAIEMTFYPIDFKGIAFGKSLRGFDLQYPGIGWQGIIPMHAEKIAGISVDLMTSKLINIKETFSKIDPDRIAEELRPVVKEQSKEIINEAMETHMRLIWRALPERRKQLIYDQAAAEFPEVIRELMTDIKDNIEDLFDLKALAIDSLVANRDLLNQLFLRCGEKEFAFIKRSGLYFGFLFGIGQMFVWNAWPSFWVLLFGGLLVGWATNWLALKLIFYPQRPIRLGFVTIQGLFIKRQQEVAKEYAAFVTEDILTAPKIFERIINGEGASLIQEISRKHVMLGVDKTAGFNRSLIQLSSGTRTYKAMKELAVARFIEQLPQNVARIFDYTEDALDLENLIRSKMQALGPEDFVGVLRPAYEEDEWKLIAVGAALGGVAGCIQYLVL